MLRSHKTHVIVSMLLIFYNFYQGTITVASHHTDNRVFIAAYSADILPNLKENPKIPQSAQLLEIQLEDLVTKFTELAGAENSIGGIADFNLGCAGSEVFTFKDSLKELVGTKKTLVGDIGRKFIFFSGDNQETLTQTKYKYLATLPKEEKYLTDRFHIVSPQNNGRKQASWIWTPQTDSEVNAPEANAQLPPINPPINNPF